MPINHTFVIAANFWRLLTIIIVLGSASKCIAQNDTIYLRELVISNKTEKEKVEIIKFRENCKRAEGMHNISELISQMNPPAGYLHHVTFYFNKRDYPNNDNAIKNLRDSQFQLVIYEVGGDGLPGPEISGCTKIIIVPRGHQGKLTIRVRELNIYTNGKIYIGLKKLNSNTGFFFDTFCYLPDTPQTTKDKYKTLSRTDDSKPWRNHIGCLAIRTELGVSIAK